MREYAFNIKSLGLKDTADSMVGMESLKNSVPREGYWQTPAEFTMISVTGETFPFPQIYRGKFATLVFGSDQVYLLDEDTLELTSLDIQDLTAGGVWHVADFGASLVASNGVNTVAWLPDIDSESETFGEIIVTVLDGDHTYGTVGEYQGGARFIYGDGPAGSNWAGWSAIGTDDLRGLLLGDDIPDRTTLRLEDGRGVMPSQGTVLAVKSLGDNWVAYGSDAVCVMRPVKGSFGLFPVDGLPDGIGLLNRGAAAGNDGGHLFVGSDNSLWAVRPDGTAQWLKCSNHMATLTNPVVSFDPVMQDFWISDAAQAYVWSKQGLGGPMTMRPYSIAILKGHTVVATGAGYDGDAVIFEAVSNVFDWGQSGMNKVVGVSVGGEGYHHLRAGIKYRSATR